MKNPLQTYFGALATTVAMFMLFIACGSQMYQVNMSGDHDENKIPDSAKDQSSAQYGIHALEGWTDSLPVPYRFGDDMNDLQKKAFSKAITTWETAVGKKLFAYQGVHDGVTGNTFPDLYSSLKDGINGHYLEENWTKTEKPTVVLATTIWNNSANNQDLISSADIHFNVQNYLIGDSLYMRADGNREIVDMQSLATHELGHLLGLSHVEAGVDATSIMNPQLFIGEGLVTRKISKPDIERIQKIYGCEGIACDIDATFTYLETNIDREVEKQTTASNN